MDDLKTITAKIEALTRESGFIYTFALILVRDVFLDPNEAADMNWYDHLSFQELTFLAGLLVKHEINFDIPSEKESAERFERTYDLFSQLHQKYNEPILEKIATDITNRSPGKDSDENYQKIFGSGDSLVEAIFYAGSGAYDFQYWEFAAKKYQKDSDWLLKNKSIEISTAAKIAQTLKKFHENKYATFRPQIGPDDFQKACLAALSIFCFTSEELANFGQNVEPFLNAFSMEPGTANPSLEIPGQYNVLQSNPIVRFPDGRYFLPIGFTLSESIYESPFYWMIHDPKYSEEAFRHRGKSAEEIAVDLLKRTFGERNVYTQVEVKKNDDTTVTDIDVLAIAGNKAIVAQVKSKRLTELSKTGDEKSLNRDFQGAVQDAYNQGLLSRTAIVEKSNKLFVNGRELVLNEQIDDAYILCLTLDNYPSVFHQVDVFLKKKKADPFPIAISILDLDIVTFYLNDPFEFLYYLHQRIKHYQIFRADTEITLLAVHLKYKLFPQKEHNGKAIDMQGFDNSFSQLIDANFPAMRGYAPKTKATQKLYPNWKNEDFEKLVNQVKSAGDPGFADALFFLYDLAGNGADQLIGAIKEVKERTSKDHQRHDARVLYDKGKRGITIMSAETYDELQVAIFPHSIISKYRSQSDIWLSLGSIAGSPNFVDIIGFNKDPWKHNKELDSMTRELFEGSDMTATSFEKKVGRNEMCLCGSGKKYKKCHGA